MLGSSRELGEAAQHFIDVSEKLGSALSYRVCMLLKGAVKTYYLPLINASRSGFVFSYIGLNCFKYSGRNL